MDSIRRVFSKQEVYTCLKKVFGFTTFKGNQEAIIMDLLSGKDVMVIMPTGGGKSLCYQLPAVMMDGLAIIISPLIALMKNQVDTIRHMYMDDSIAHFLNSSLGKHEIMKVKQDIQDRRTKMLYIAPESLMKEENVQFLQQIPLSFVAIDEAHCISEWGHDFRPEYRRIREMVTNIGQQIPIIALTATATEKVRSDILKNLDIEDASLYISSFNRPNLYYEVRPKPDDEKTLIKEIIHFIKDNEGKSGIIYCLARKKVEDVAQILTINGIKALPYHAGLDAKQRAATQDKFLMEEIDVIVATIAFGMGIDKPDVRYVIHYDMPKSLEGYYQETGRAGRDGGEGRCIAFYSERDISKFERFLVDKTLTEREVAEQLMESTISYAESAVCRRVTLLSYFSEYYPEESCGNCDNCLHPKKRIECKEDIIVAINLIEQTKEMFKADHLINILLGNATTEVKTCRHHKLALFGYGKDQSKLHWKAVFRQCIIEGFVKKDIESFGLLKLLPKALEFREHPYDILVPEDHDYAHPDDDDEVVSLQSSSDVGADSVLFAILKDLRKSIAHKEKLAPNIIFEERSLVDMTIQYPTTIEKMSKIIGVGEAKARRYGKEFCDIIAKYVQENDIIPPEQLIVKSNASTSTGIKTYIIKSIDKNIDFEDIAKGKNMDMNELLDNIERIISFGNKLDITYYINKVVEEEHQEEIIACFQDLETDDIQTVLDELDDDEYTEEEVRLMRIYFISKYGH
jgi:ATP-dependent DNA helicase RecQ